MTDQSNRNRSNTGFGSMDDDEQRRIAQKGGQTSANEQNRDDQGQFSGSGRSGTQGGSQGNQGGSQGTSNQGGSQGTSNRGFASMDDDEQRRIAQKGGQASHGGQGGNTGDRSGSNR